MDYYCGCRHISPFSARYTQKHFLWSLGVNSAQGAGAIYTHNGTVINKTVELYADHKYGSKFAVNEDIYSTIV